jgi:hypothetical protein
MTKDVDIYRAKKGLKKVEDSKIDLKDPSVLKKYQGIVASGSARHRPLSTYQGRASSPKVYRHPSPPRQFRSSGSAAEPPPSGVNKELQHHPNLWILVAIILIIVIVILAEIFLYK